MSDQIPDYSPPWIVAAMGALLRIPRKGHETDFAYAFSTDRDLQHEYVEGVFVAATAFLSFYVTWAFVLIVLKVKGKEVGCASGRAFHTEVIDEDMQSTDSSESYSISNIEANSSGKDGSIESNNNIENLNISEDPPIFEDHCDEPLSCEGSEEYDSQEDWLSTDELQTMRNPRESRTRFCFLFFSLISLLCVPLILMFAFGPMRETARSSDDVLLVVNDTVKQVSKALETIEGTAISASELVEKIPSDNIKICPLVRKEDYKSELGVDLNQLVETVSLKFDDVDSFVMEMLQVLENVVDRVSDGMIAFENSAEKTDQLLWIVPGVLFAVSVLVAAPALGVLLAWKNKIGTRIQFALSYIVLPLLILISAACWFLTITAAFVTMASADFCTAGERGGSPDDTIQEILSMHDRGQNDTVHKLINAYTNRCIGGDPTEDIRELEITIQDTVDVIWRQLSRVDSIGRDSLIEQCGGGTTLASLFAGAKDLAKLLATVRKSLSSARGLLECQRINPIYNQVTHDYVCTEAASATAFGFLLFLILSISTMTLISLRASWLKNVEEEKVYHDENEIAENMILDEHEEYLAYISRYKHEWQEYNGFEATSVVQSNAHSYKESGSEGSSFSGEYPEEDSRAEFHDETDNQSICSGPSGLDVEIFSSSFHACSVDDGARACAIDEISFPSLSAHQSEESVGVSIREEELFARPSPLLPPPDNSDAREDAPDEILIPSTEIVLKESRTRKMRSWSFTKSRSSRSIRSNGSDDHAATCHARIGVECALKNDQIDRIRSDHERPGTRSDHERPGNRTVHERPDTPAAAKSIHMRGRVSTWDGSGVPTSQKTDDMTIGMKPADDLAGRQLHHRTATWGGGESYRSRRTTSSTEEQMKSATGDDGLERRHSFGSKKIRRPSTGSVGGCSLAKQTRNSDIASTSSTSAKEISIRRERSTLAKQTRNSDIASTSSTSAKEISIRRERSSLAKQIRNSDIAPTSSTSAKEISIRRERSISNKSRNSKKASSPTHTSNGKNDIDESEKFEL